ncbi:hypothetical protein ABZW30_30910 [Kitasatospora sp. NPDC004669]|uniref:hypothetical protein n=1 Tax=Kitasatospora sp. NPDC004669 TaxID=3154555 RepID=UPI0033AE6255
MEPRPPDALIGETTREHADLDLVVLLDQLGLVREVLARAARVLGGADGRHVREAVVLVGAGVLDVLGPGGGGLVADVAAREDHAAPQRHGGLVGAVAKVLVTAAR